MNMKKPLIAVAVAAALATALVGCSAAEAPAPKPTTQQQDKTPSKAPETPKEDAPAATGDAPEWAEGAVDKGDKLGEITTDGWKVQIYQVGTSKTEKDSMFVDKETGKNLLPAGSDVVFLNFVYTNTSSAAVNLGASLGSPTLRSTSWKYMSGQPGESSGKAYEALGLSDDGHKTGVQQPYVVGPGQTFSQADSIAYVPGDKVEASVRITPVDDAGSLVHDKKQEGKTELTIK
jgi:hypothetical protein